LEAFHDHCAAVDGFSTVADGADGIFLRHISSVVKGCDGVVYVAEEPPSLAGYMMAVKKQRLPVYGTEPVGEISDIYVKPGYRNSDTGRLLVEAAEDWFMEQGITLAWLRVHSGNCGGIGFWDRIGYADHAIEKMKRLAPKKA
jgi:GNAT superfamily N-acetyltransferase